VKSSKTNVFVYVNSNVIQGVVTTVSLLQMLLVLTDPAVTFPTVR